jgi:glutathione S-transferase
MSSSGRHHERRRRSCRSQFVSLPFIINNIMSKRLITLYYDWSSPPSRAAMMFCKHLLGDSGFKAKETRLMKNDHKTEEYTKINPIQQIPAILETDEDGVSKPFTLSESSTIMRYIMNTRFAGNPDFDHLYPSKDLQARAKVDEYLDWNHVGLRFNTNRYVKLHYFFIVRGQTPDPKAQQEVKEALKNSFRLLDERLQRNEEHGSKSSFLASTNGKCTLADFVAASDLLSLRFLYPEGKDILTLMATPRV